jgi:hypothetical protein
MSWRDEDRAGGVNLNNLKDLSDYEKVTHLQVMRNRFTEAMPTSPLAGNDAYPPYVDNLLEYLRDNLDKILKGGPDDLISTIDAIKLGFPDFHAQAQRKRASKAWKSHAKDAAAVGLVEKCFDYDKFAKKSTTWGAYALIDAIGVRICPYCQLHHVNYHMPSDKKAFSLRPPLDHYFPRSNYPYLAVSLSNLIPCCSQCNSGVKLALDPLSLGLRHPRVATPIGRVKFSAQGSVPCQVGGTSSDVKLTIIPNDLESGAHVQAFKLEERYQWYSREIFDLMKNYNRFMEYPKDVRDTLWQKEFVLGFPPAAAADRALGLCLLNVYAELESGLIV